MRRPQDDPLAEPLLRPAEAAEALDVSVAEVRRLVRDRRLPALRVGLILRLHAEHLRRFAARRAG